MILEFECRRAMKAVDRALAASQLNMPGLDVRACAFHIIMPPGIRSFHVVHAADMTEAEQVRDAIKVVGYDVRLHGAATHDGSRVSLYPIGDTPVSAHVCETVEVITIGHKASWLLLSEKEGLAFIILAAFTCSDAFAPAAA